MRINFACGRKVLDGYYNVDAVRSPKAARAPELLHVWSPSNPLPLAEGCAEEVLSIHFLEHVYRWEAPALVGEWRRLLKPGGRLVLELPNLIKCCQNIINGVQGKNHPDQLGMWGAYGDPSHEDPYMTHRWGWTPETLSALLSEHGFDQIKEEPTQWHSIGRANRDMRIVSRKRDG